MTNTNAPAAFDFTNPSCPKCGLHFTRRFDVGRHQARKHPVTIKMTPISALKVGDLVEWADERRAITDVRLIGRKPRVFMGHAVKVDLPSMSTRLRKVTT